MTDYNHTEFNALPTLPVLRARTRTANLFGDTFDEKIISTTQLLVKYIPEESRWPTLLGFRYVHLAPSKLHRLAYNESMNY